MDIDDKRSPPLTLSWGDTDEILVGSASLTLYHATEISVVIWRRQLSKPVKFAKFSYDASLIASTSTYDSTIKLWQRQSFGSVDARFEYIYLPHPSIVTDIHWRRPSVTEHHDGPNVLYTTCADYHVRVWAPTDTHSPHDLRQMAQINLQDSIQPRVPPSANEESVRYAFIVDGGDFEMAVQGALRRRRKTKEGEHHKFDHLSEVSRRKPDLCIVLDNKGHMSAWGVDGTECKARNEARVYNVAHVEHLNVPTLRTIGEQYHFANFEAFCDDTPESPLTLLIHRFDENISWLEGSIEMFLDPVSRTERLQTKAVWDGHEQSITRLVRDKNGQGLLSYSSDGEAVIWQHGKESRQALQSISRVNTAEENDHILYLSTNQVILTFNNGSLDLWKLAADEDEKVASCNTKFGGKILSLFDLHISGAPSNVVFVAGVDSERIVRIWKIHLPNEDQPFFQAESTFRIQHFCDSTLQSQAPLALVAPTNSAGSISRSRGMHIPTTKAQVISCTSTGIVQAWAFRLDVPDQVVQIVPLSLIQTQVVNPTKICASSAGHLAVIDYDRTGVSIWDLQSEFLEFHKLFSAHEPIQCLDWCFTPDGHMMVVIGLPYKIVLLVQSRLDFLHNVHSWISVREFDTKDYTALPIGDIAWLSDCSFVVGIGNQLFVYGNGVSSENHLLQDAQPLFQHCKPQDLFEIARYANRPLVIYHPQVLYQYILAAELGLVERVVIALSNALTLQVPGDEVDSFVGLPLSLFQQYQAGYPSGLIRQTDLGLTHDAEEDDTRHLSEDLAMSLSESMTNLSSPHITSLDRLRLSEMIQSLGSTARDFHSLDRDGLRYILLFRLHLSKISQDRTNTLDASISYREYTFALHSTSQDLLTSVITNHSSSSRLLWPHARSSGLFMWLSDPAALHQQFESVARNEYTKTNEKNPADCALYYLALRKKQILLGLWRMAHWNREQRSTMKLLGNNFDEPRWKTAALKNAYALLGKRRFGYAASFFLLAGKCEDAVNVCVHQIGDLQLGVAVARVYEGDDGPVLKNLLRENILPNAARTNNRFQAHWAFWMLGEKAKAVRALHAPLTSLIHISGPQDRQAMSYRNLDPAHLIMYRELRHYVKSKEDVISPKEEWDFVMKIVRLYIRMGCALLALGLVRNYKFLDRPQRGDGRVVELEGIEGDEDEDGSESSSDNSEASSNGKDEKDNDDDVEGEEEPKRKKPPPTQFQEPSASSLLDNFGF